MLDFGESSIGYTYTKTITFRNDTDLPAKFELVPQEETSQLTATYSVDEPEGIVEGYSSNTITVSFVAKKLGIINLPMHFRYKL
jgi:hypothetical protein